MSGRVVKNLANGKQNAGYSSVQWNGINDVGQQATAGIYIYRLISTEHKESRKMILVK